MGQLIPHDKEGRCINMRLSGLDSKIVVAASIFSALVLQQATLPINFSRPALPARCIYGWGLSFF